MPSCSIRQTVCPSVRPSVTFVNCVKTSKLIIRFFSPSDSHTILVFPYQTSWQYSDGDLPPDGGVECRWGRRRRGLPNTLLRKLQSVQNATARLITGTRRCDHITQVLRELHWLPIRERVKFKLACLVHQSLSGQSPA